MQHPWKSLALVIATLALVACGGGSKAATTPTEEVAQEAAAPADEHHAGEHHAAADTAAPAADVKAPGEAQVGDATTCPVSGNTFTVTAESASVEHDGKTYYFCCPGCDKRFQDDPGKYLNN